MLSSLLLFLSSALHVSSQATWCGKNYKPDQPIVDPGGAYPVPQESPPNEPLLLFRCAPEFRLHIQGDSGQATILVDIAITHTKMNWTSPFFSTDMDSEDRTQALSNSRFLVTLSTETIPLLATREMGFGLNQRLNFPLLPFTPQKQPHSITCTARLAFWPGWASKPANRPRPPAREFTASTSLSYQVPNGNGSTVKINAKNRGLLFSYGGHQGQVMPYGFYTAFDDYLAKNLSILDEALERGYNLVHPVPTFRNLTALEMVLDKMEELGLFLMYDLRWVRIRSFKNATKLIEEVNRIKSRKNLLLWYTADEPDGWGDDPSDVKRAYDLINELDGYHPISLVLNCQDYNFRAYAIGTADILLQDTYPIGINATYSAVYGTPCTRKFGVCGCDNCVGKGIVEIADRLDGIHNMLEWEGRTGVPVWSVVQAFGNQSFWSRVPTDREFIAQVLVSLIHGSRGIVPWIEPTTEDIASVSSRLGKIWALIRLFLLNAEEVSIEPPDTSLPSQVPSNSQMTLPGVMELLPAPSLGIPPQRSLQRGVWQIAGGIIKLVLASNLGADTVSFRVGSQGGKGQELRVLLTIGATVSPVKADEGLGIDGWEVTLEEVGSVVLATYTPSVQNS